jgi:membrane protein
MRTPFPDTALRLLKRSFAGWTEDGAASMGAALAFYSLLSMAPLVVLVIALAGLIIGADEAQRLMMAQLSGLVGEGGATAIKSLLDAAGKRGDGLIATLVSMGTLLLGATTVFAELKTDLDRIWKVKARKSRGLWDFIRTRVLSFGLVVAIGFLLLVSLVVTATLSYIGTFLGGGKVLLYILEFVGSMVVMTGLFATTYKVLPSEGIAWRDVWVGAAVTALLFWIGKLLIGLYLGHSATASSFGAAGTLVVTIVWVYYSAQIFFLGAEFTRHFSLSHGAQAIGPAANSEFLPAEADLVDRARGIVLGQDPTVTPR